MQCRCAEGHCPIRRRCREPDEGGRHGLQMLHESMFEILAQRVPSDICDILRTQDGGVAGCVPRPDKGPGGRTMGEKVHLRGGLGGRGLLGGMCGADRVVRVAPARQERGTC